MISVIIEGHNETNNMGTADDTIEALKKQQFPQDQVNLILVGTTAQANVWRQRYADSAPFASMRAIGLDGGNYYSFKNIGIDACLDEFAAMTDSDLLPDPGWLSAIVAALSDGADVSIGLSKFVGANGDGPLSLFILTLSAISWGWIVGKKRGKDYIPNGLHSHNTAFRTASAKRLRFPEDRGRTCGSMLLFQQARALGMDVRLTPGQIGTHAFNGDFIPFHIRVGYEILVSRGLAPDLPNGWTTRTGIFEPIICTVLHGLFDVPQAYRYAAAVGLNPLAQLALVCCAIPCSVFLRSVQAAGMYATMVAPAQMRKWVEQQAAPTASVAELSPSI